MSSYEIPAPAPQPTSEAGSDEGEVELRALVEAEERLPLDIFEDRPLRVKKTDRCGLSCSFCHNEGTVAPTPNRQSIYIAEGTPPAGLLEADDMQPDEDLSTVLQWMRDICLISEVHWTGGEPTLNPDLPDSIALAAEIGLLNKITSNGQRGAAGLAELQQAGLHSINFSIYGLHAEQFMATQVRCSRQLAERRIAALHEAMAGALALGMSAKANIVLQRDTAHERIVEALGIVDPKVKLRFQADLREQAAGAAAFRKTMLRLGGEPVSRQISVGSSNQLINYAIPGREQLVGFKSFRHSRMEMICRDCPLDMAGECDEGYYGPRLFVEKGKQGLAKYVIGVCLQRLELAQGFEEMRSEFEASDYSERGIPQALTGHLSLAHAIRRQAEADMLTYLKRGETVRYYHTVDGELMVLPPRAAL